MLTYWQAVMDCNNLIRCRYFHIELMLHPIYWYFDAIWFLAIENFFIFWKDISYQISRYKPTKFTAKLYTNRVKFKFSLLYLLLNKKTIHRNNTKIPLIKSNCKQIVFSFKKKIEFFFICSKFFLLLQQKMRGKQCWVVDFGQPCLRIDMRRAHFISN